jgi:imidazoleglycerol-phosphate dehydratase
MPVSKKKTAPVTGSKRSAACARKTGETDIKIKLDIDGTGKNSIDTGIGFFDHMLSAFSRHGFFDLDCTVKGDLRVDGHHSVEDCGIVLGDAIKKAVGDKKGINRYGYFILPMDEVLVLCSLDLCDRPYLGFEYEYRVPMIGELDTELVREFFYAVSYSAGMNLHIKVLSDGNAHHVTEAMFKAFAKALDMATGYDKRIDGVLSTKGAL